MQRPARGGLALALWPAGRFLASGFAHPAVVMHPGSAVTLLTHLPPSGSRPLITRTQIAPRRSRSQPRPTLMRSPCVSPPPELALL